MDEQLDEYMREAARDAKEVDELVLVYVDATPFARTLIRRGWRLAQGMHADLRVAYLDRDGGDPAQRELARTPELAEDLNATIEKLSGGDEAKVHAAFVRAAGINHIVLAHRPRAGLRRAMRASLADRLLAAAPSVDVHLVSEA